MNTNSFKCKVTANKKKYSRELDLNYGISSDICPGLKISIEKDKGLINTVLLNECAEDIFINRLEIQINSFNCSDYEACLVNPENPREYIELKTMYRGKHRKKTISFLFGVFIAKERFNNKFAGFLSSHSARNYIKAYSEDDKIEVYAVYDFINHKLTAGEQIMLDSVYLDSGNSYINLVRRYVDSILAVYPLQQQDRNAVAQPGYGNNTCEYILYSDSIKDPIVRVEGKPAVIKAGKKKLYLVDICSLAGQELIFDKIRDITRRAGNMVHIREIAAYIKKIEELKLFNPYFQLNKLLLNIKSDFSHVNLCFDDCPQGLSIGKDAVIYQNFGLDGISGFMGKLLHHGQSTCINNLMVKTMLQEAALAHNSKYETRNAKVKELLEIVTGSINKPPMPFKELEDIREDIESNSRIIPYLGKENVFGFLVEGKKSVYIAMLNLSKRTSRFYWDFSMDVKEEVLHGAATEVFSNQQLLISDGKIYLRKMEPMDCCLFRSERDQNKILQEIV